jgi:hypothetical protein
MDQVINKLTTRQTQAATQMQATVNILATRFDQMMGRMAVCETLQAVTAAALTIEIDEADSEPPITTTTETGEDGWTQTPTKPRSEGKRTM